MKLIITAGGTTERIDDVRAITNMSTGRLGKIIGEAFLKEYGNRIDTLYYLHGSRAEVPEGTNVVPVPIGGVSDLEKNLKEILERERIDGVIHAMAVSDYTVREVITLKDLQEGKSLDSANKISSEIEDLVILLKKTPKVISSIKKWSPETLLVGFKLLSGVPREELITVAHNLLQKNGCTFVLANDLTEIKGDAHPGYLVHVDKSYDEMGTKEEIARTISHRVMEELGGM